MSLEEVAALESSEYKTKLCVACVEGRGFEKALEDQPWECSKCRTPLVGQIMHVQRCFNPDECLYEHMHISCYNEILFSNDG